ncbi:MAG: hypothetical protein WBM83_07820, partial [Flavobacteriaceae bacterium]
MGQLKFALVYPVWMFFAFLPSLSVGQEVKNVPEAFTSISTEPEVLFFNNTLNSYREGGHLQGVQVIEKNEKIKLLISGSSSSNAYLMELDLATRKTERLISLMS